MDAWEQTVLSRVQEQHEQKNWTTCTHMALKPSLLFQGFFLQLSVSTAWCSSSGQEKIFPAANARIVVASCRTEDLCFFHDLSLAVLA